MSKIIDFSEIQAFARRAGCAALRPAKRVDLGRALAMEALLLDEPMAA
jgi:ABC-type branched-subunit amino acid transport system ATPase component